MRYPKGSIIITEEGDVPLLRHVRNCRFVSQPQLFHLLQHDAGFMNVVAHAWRLKRLLRGGYIRILNGHRHRRSAIYSIAPLGLLELESYGDYCLSLNSETRHMPHPLQVHHCLELNDIRLALIRSSLLVSWRSEVEIASDNLFHGTYVKNYDAVVAVRIGQESRIFALEYERTRKDARRYALIRSKFENEINAPCIVYLASSFRIARLLALHLTPSTKPVAIALAHSFREQLLGTEAITNVPNRVVSLSAFLASAPRLPSPRSAVLDYDNDREHILSTLGDLADGGEPWNA